MSLLARGADREGCLRRHAGGRSDPPWSKAAANRLMRRNHSSPAGAPLREHATFLPVPDAREEQVSEIIFVVEDAADGGLLAKAVGASIVTEADSMQDLREVLRDAVRCHFEEADRPQLIRIHYVRDEVIAA